MECAIIAAPLIWNIFTIRTGWYTRTVANRAAGEDEKRPAGGDVSVEGVGGEREVLGVALHDGDPLEGLLLPGLVELVRGLVEQRDVLRVDVLDDAERGEPRAAADVDDREVAAEEVGRFQRVVAHVLGPVARIDDVVVHDGEEAVEPEGLLLVLDEARRRGGPRRRGGRRRRASQPGAHRDGAAHPPGEGEGAGEAGGLGGAEEAQPRGTADPASSLRERPRASARRVGGGHRHCRRPRCEDEEGGCDEESEATLLGLEGREDVWWLVGVLDGWAAALRGAVLSFSHTRPAPALLAVPRVGVCARACARHVGQGPACLDERQIFFGSPR
jgi:hypothetical protein